DALPIYPTRTGRCRTHAGGLRETRFTPCSRMRHGEFCTVFLEETCAFEGHTAWCVGGVDLLGSIPGGGGEPPAGAFSDAQQDAGGLRLRRLFVERAAGGR